ncbi:hypothetical protein ACFXGO_18925 [Streptomyces roseus]|uniref:hypothetical protein n=1 Tax=Streptomyces roseus TaxID=66430 RepID=UPI00367AD2BE
MNALHAFLGRRIGYLLQTHPADSEEHRAAEALHYAVKWTWEALQDCLPHLHGNDETVLPEISDCWAGLRGFALPWRDAPDYDDRLWPPIAFEPVRFVPVHGGEASPPASQAPS